MEILDQPTSSQDFTMASDGNRIVAVLIDGLLTFGVSLIPFVGWIVGVSYFLLKDAFPFLDGQSIGKKAMNIRVVTEDGEPITGNYGPALVRQIVLYIPFFAIVELVVMITNPLKMRLGDQWAKTKVISTI